MRITPRRSLGGSSDFNASQPSSAITLARASRPTAAVKLLRSSSLSSLAISRSCGRIRRSARHGLPG